MTNKYNILLPIVPPYTMQLENTVCAVQVTPHIEIGGWAENGWYALADCMDNKYTRE